MLFTRTWLEYPTQEGGAAPPVGEDDDPALVGEIASIVPFSLKVQGNLVLIALSPLISRASFASGFILEINYCRHTAVNYQDFEQLFHDSNIL